MFIDLKDKPVLIVGGGTVALRKLQKLSPYGVRPTVAAPEILPEIADFPGVKLKQKDFTVSDLQPRPSLVIAATDNKTVNRRVSLLCRKRHIPVNVVDNPALCSFLFPALVQRGAFSAGISTGGASPTAAAYFRERIQELLPDGLEELLTWLESLRPLVKAAVPEQNKRGAIFQKLFAAGMAKGTPLTQTETEKYIGSAVSPGTAAGKDIGSAARGSVALVGAGCGKADLITVRGLRLLRQCQAVVYDDLIDAALLDAVPESAEKIYVGKRSGTHAATQDAINQKLIKLARSGLKVVRLKGGDPYLFGRGGEEMMALKAAGISCQEVPGIPSPTGIAAEAGIPVTHRGISRSVHIVTAHTADTGDGLPEDFDALAKLSGTLIFLMGLERLPMIAARLIDAGMAPSTPAAVISGGNAPNPVRVRAPLSCLAREAENAGASAPAIILIGGTAALDLSADFRGPEALLKGVRIGLTGTWEIVEKQRLALQALGAETVLVMHTEIKELPAAYDRRIPDTAPCWIVFTSANGVNTFFRQITKKNTDLLSLQKTALNGTSMKGTSPKEIRFAVIGPATGKALSQYGIAADLCPDVYTSEHLAAAIAAAAKPGEKVLLLRSTLATRTLPEMLQKAGLDVEDIPIYVPESKPCAVPLPKLDYLTFSSAGGVKAFGEQYGAIPSKTRCVCIGSVTAKTLAQSVDAPFLTSSEISAEGIVEAIVHDREGKIPDEKGKNAWAKTPDEYP